MRGMEPSASLRLSDALAALPRPIAAVHERELRTLSTTCGCTEATVGALLLAAAALGRAAYSFTGWSLGGIAITALECALGFVVGAFAGKLAGLALARLRRRALGRRIERAAAVHLH